MAIGFLRLARRPRLSLKVKFNECRKPPFWLVDRRPYLGKHVRGLRSSRRTQSSAGSAPYRTDQPHVAVTTPPPHAVAPASSSAHGTGRLGTYQINEAKIGR